MTAEYNKYLLETPMLNYSHPEIRFLVLERGWENLDEFSRIKSIYNFVRDEIPFGYNIDDGIPASKVLKDGWLRTGDYGYLDKDGMLFITGRKKNVIVTKNGKNIFPEEVEYYLMKSPYIKEVIVDGIDDGTGELIVTAHIVPEEDEMKALGEMNDEQTHKFFKKIIDDVNDGMSSYKRVKKFEIRTEEFEKTSTRKIKRYGSNTQNK